MKKNKIEKVMHEFKNHDLMSSSGDEVHSRKQAIAIALSEQRHQDEMHKKRQKGKSY